ncbi:TraR/DksA C4-type zinc finger protein [Asanoa sp. WMMD1127]|uniref:TraR/DksA family transcriptional regulator n=1 Tax=Asanoa sp. WMMD1127 TaxID=3016107 RepID=UPI002415B2AC|nr:TraR/DksA C4-type zinc finger protein [Asanoa sp. WMMD1127]MDG4826484.1 TraR/DksA C4-type zinc finger protein [Asanoa sp. WMMD1127]
MLLEEPTRTDQIRLTLQARYDELTAEYEAERDRGHLLRLVEASDTAGDDQADSGTKAAERDAFRSVLGVILDRRAQYEHALSRLAAGSYGHCEGCSAPIPVERLEIFPAATSCVACKQTRERRAA